MIELEIRKKVKYLRESASPFLQANINGTIDKKSVVKLEEFFKQVKEERYKIIILEFSKVHGIDSTGLGILTNFSEYLKNDGISLKFINVPRKITHLFEMLGLNKYFEVYANLDEVLRTLEKKTTDNTIKDKSEDSVIKRDILQKEKVVFSVQKDKTKKKPIKEQDIVRIEYYFQMLKSYTYPIKINLNIKNLIKEDNKIEIQSFFPGCIVVPSQRKILVENPNIETSLFVTPLSSNSSLKSEILIFTHQKKNVTRIPLNIKIKNKKIFNFINKLALFFLFFGIIFEIFRFPIRVEQSFFIFNWITKILENMGGMFGILLAIFLLSVGYILDFFNSPLKTNINIPLSRENDI